MFLASTLVESCTDLEAQVTDEEIRGCQRFGRLALVTAIGKAFARDAEFRKRCGALIGNVDGNGDHFCDIGELVSFRTVRPHSRKT